MLACTRTDTYACLYSIHDGREVPDVHASALLVEVTEWREESGGLSSCIASTSETPT